MATIDTRTSKALLGSDSNKTPYQDPNTVLVNHIIDLMNMVKSSENNPALNLQQQNLKSQALNLSNPLNSSPYQQLFKNMGYAAPDAQSDTQNAFAPGLLSIENQQASNVRSGEAMATGLGSILNYAKPEISSPGNVPYSPLTGTQGGFLGSEGGNSLADIGGSLQQMEAGKDLQTQTDAYNKTNGLISNFKSMIKKNPTFNPSPLILANQLESYLKTGVVSDPNYTSIINTLQEIATTIGPVLGTPGNPTDLKTTIADSIVPRLMAGQDIATVLDNLEKNAKTKLNRGYTTSHGKPFSLDDSSDNSSGSTYTLQEGDDLMKVAQSHGMTISELEKLNPQIGGNYNLIKPGEKLYLSTNSNNRGSSGTVSAGGYGFKLVNGKWVPA